MGDQLKNPPLIEAACEFRSDPASEWDWTVPGRLFDDIGDEFSVRSEVRRLGLSVKLAGETAPPPTVIEAGPDRIQLKRPDGSAMVQVGPKLLVINHLRPYTNWETFRDLILRIYRTYCDITGSNTLGRLGLRYINHIPQAEQAIEDTITLRPALSRSLDRSVSTFYQRYEFTHEDPKGILIHQTGLQLVDEKPVIMLDLDFGSQDVGEIRTAETVIDWLDRAHDRVEEGFIDSLVPSFYDRLKRGED